MAQDKNSTSVCFLWLNNPLVCQIAGRREERKALVAVKCSESVLPPSSHWLGAPMPTKRFLKQEAKAEVQLPGRGENVRMGWEALESPHRIMESSNWKGLELFCPCLSFRDCWKPVCSMTFSPYIICLSETNRQLRKFWGLAGSHLNPSCFAEIQFQRGNGRTFRSSKL